MGNVVVLGIDLLIGSGVMADQIDNFFSKSDIPSIISDDQDSLDEINISDANYISRQLIQEDIPNPVNESTVIVSPESSIAVC